MKEECRSIAGTGITGPTHHLPPSNPLVRPGGLPIPFEKAQVALKLPAQCDSPSASEGFLEVPPSGSMRSMIGAEWRRCAGALALGKEAPPRSPSSVCTAPDFGDHAPPPSH